jgi:hypothetical protein
MEREIIRVEPFDTNFEKWGAPVSVCTRAGNIVFVSGLSTWVGALRTTCCGFASDEVTLETGLGFEGEVLVDMNILRKTRLMGHR